MLKGAIEKLSGERTSIGIDITDPYVQISYADEKGELQTFEEEGSLLIPAVLSKEKGKDIWSCGAEAVSAANSILVKDILSKAHDGNLVEIDGMDYDPVDLLALLIKKCLSKLARVCPLERIGTVALTVETPDNRTVAVLDQAISIVRIKREQVVILSHAESAYFFVLNEPKGLRSADVLICNLDEAGLKSIYLKQNRNTTPVAVLSDERMHSSFKKEDKYLSEIMKGLIGDNDVSAVYLLGTEFSGEWYPESLNLICRGRRAFLGTNLFSKGAVIAALERAGRREPDKTHVFLGPDKLRSNLGLNVVREGEDAYMALLDAGRSWFEAAHECDLILDDPEPLEIAITPINGMSARTVRVKMDGFPKRPPRASRIHLEIRMISDTKAKIKITDLGFGDLFPSSGLSWESEFLVS